MWAGLRPLSQLGWLTNNKRRHQCTAHKSFRKRRLCLSNENTNQKTNTKFRWVYKCTFNVPSLLNATERSAANLSYLNSEPAIVHQQDQQQKYNDGDDWKSERREDGQQLLSTMGHRGFVLRIYVGWVGLSKKSDLALTKQSKQRKIWRQSGRLPRGWRLFGVDQLIGSRLEEEVHIPWYGGKGWRNLGGDISFQAWGIQRQPGRKLTRLCWDESRPSGFANCARHDKLETSRFLYINHCTMRSALKKLVM